MSMWRPVLALAVVLAFGAGAVLPIAIAAPLDSDFDGFSDEDEEFLGTDPLNFASHPTLSDRHHHEAILTTYWPLATNAVEALGSGLDGDLRNGACFLHSALQLDGRNDYVNFGNDPALNVSSNFNFTFSLWVRPEFKRKMKRVLGKFQTRHRNREYCAFFLADRLWSFFSDDGSCRHGHTILKVTAPRVVKKNQWRHIAVAWNSTNGADGVAMYVDGLNVPAWDICSSDISSLHSGTADFTLGSYDIRHVGRGRRKREIVRNAFKGSMAQLILCNGALTDLEAQEIYLLGRDGDLLSYIQTDFDEDGIVDWWERKYFGDVSRPAPETKAVVSPDANQHGWHKMDAAVDLFVDEELTDVATTFFSINGGAAVEGSHIELQAQGIYAVSYWSVYDLSGKSGERYYTEPAKEFSIRIDLTDPMITSFSPAQGESIEDRQPRIEITFPDALSGVDPASVVLKVDWVDVTANAVVTATNVVYVPGADLFEGSHTVAISLEDNAGNSAAGRITFTVDVDTDADGLPDWWEEMYLGGLDSGPADDVDGDGLSNLQEHQLGSDPGNSDTDRDGFTDGFEPDYAVSRAFIDLGDEDFTLGDDYIYTMPDWLVRVFKVGGEWVAPGPPGQVVPLGEAMGSPLTNPIDLSSIDWENPDVVLMGERIYLGQDWLLRVYKQDDEWMVQEICAPLTQRQAQEILRSNALLLPYISELVDQELFSGFNPGEWHVPASEPDGMGKLYIELDRNLVTNDLVMEIQFFDHAGSSLYIELLAADDSVITNLGNIITGTDQVLWRTNDIPLEGNPAATKICLHRGTGEVTVAEMILYVDQDGDQLDAGQEALLGTSDLSTDSDGDGTGDKVEVDAGTDPTNSASFLAGISGTISYGGSETGTVWVIVNTTTNIWPAERSATLPAPGVYTVTSSPTLTNYWIHAFLDWNGNKSYDCWEPTGSYALNSHYLTDNASGIDITLLDPSDADSDGLPDCWELKYFGSPTGAAATTDEEPDGLDNLGEYRRNTDPHNPDTDGDGRYDGGGFIHIGFSLIKLEFVSKLTRVTVSYPDDFTNKLQIFACTDLLVQDWVVAFTTDINPSTNAVSWVDAESINSRLRFYDVWNADYDGDGDGLSDGMEARIYWTDRNNPDTDGDGMKDGWEVSSNLDPNDPADAALDADGDGVSNLDEYLRGTDPNDDEDVNVVLHVDAFTGDDSNDGITAPKATIGAAIEAAISGDVIEVQEGTYTQEPTTYDLGTKSLRIVPIGSVTIIVQ